MTSSPKIFEKAHRALSKQDFRVASSYAKKAEELVWSDISVYDRKRKTAPRYSIIIVLLHWHPDLAEALRRLSRYGDDEKFELIFVNNGDLNRQEAIPKEIGHYRWIDVGFNYGCSGGRNVGARLARGEFIIFLDDDGFIEDQTIEALTETILRTSALAVRGRVLPKSGSPASAEHYDLGNTVIYSVPNAEGVSIWKRQAFLESGGFDTLLAGGEGLALWSRMYETHGPAGFLYSPKAVLRHDYAEDSTRFASKKARQAISEAYLAFAYPNAHRWRYEAALQFTERAVEMNPDDPQLYSYIGRLEQKRGKLDNAENALRRAIALDPTLADAHCTLSKVLVEKGQKEDAIDAARRAVSCAPEDVRIQNHLGQLLSRVGLQSDAEVVVMRALRLDPCLAEGHRTLSLVRLEQGRNEEAIASARRAIDCTLDKVRYYDSFGKLLWRLGCLDEAEAAERHAIDLNPRFPEAHRTLSQVLLQQGRTKEAIASARRAVDLVPDSAKYHYNLGVVLRNSKHLREAETALRRAVDLKPDMTKALELLNVTCKRQTLSRRALSWIRHWLSRSGS